MPKAPGGEAPNGKSPAEMSEGEVLRQSIENAEAQAAATPPTAEAPVTTPAEGPLAEAARRSREALQKDPAAISKKIRNLKKALDTAQKRRSDLRNTAEEAKLFSGIADLESRLAAIKSGQPAAPTQPETPIAPVISKTDRETAKRALAGFSGEEIPRPRRVTTEPAPTENAGESKILSAESPDDQKKVVEQFTEKTKGFRVEKKTSLLRGLREVAAEYRKIYNVEARRLQKTGEQSEEATVALGKLSADFEATKNAMLDALKPAGFTFKNGNDVFELIAPEKPAPEPRVEAGPKKGKGRGRPAASPEAASGEQAPADIERVENNLAAMKEGLKRLGKRRADKETLRAIRAEIKAVEAGIPSVLSKADEAKILRTMGEIGKKVMELDSKTPGRRLHLAEEIPKQPADTRKTEASPEKNGAADKVEQEWTKIWDDAEEKYKNKFGFPPKEAGGEGKRGAVEVELAKRMRRLFRDTNTLLEIHIKELSLENPNETRLENQRRQLRLYVEMVKAVETEIESTIISETKPKSRGALVRAGQETPEGGESNGDLEKSRGMFDRIWNRLDRDFQKKFGATIQELGESGVGNEPGFFIAGKIHALNQKVERVFREIEEEYAGTNDKSKLKNLYDQLGTYSEEAKVLLTEIQAADSTEKPSPRAERAPRPQQTARGAAPKTPNPMWPEGAGEKYRARGQMWPSAMANPAAYGDTGPGAVTPETQRASAGPNPTWKREPTAEDIASDYLRQEGQAHQEYGGADYRTGEQWKEEVRIYNEVLKNRASGLDEQAEKKGILGYLRKAVEGFSKLSRGKKLLVGLGIGAAGVGLTIAGAAGIAVPAMAGAAILTRVGYSAFGGMATFYGTQKALRERAILKGQAAEQALLKDNYGYDQKLTEKQKLKLQEATARGKLAEMNREGKDWDRYIVKGLVSAVAVAVGAGLVGPLIGESLRGGGKIVAGSEAGKATIAFVGDCYEKLAGGIGRTGLEVDAAGGRYPHPSISDTGEINGVGRTGLEVDAAGGKYPSDTGVSSRASVAAKAGVGGGIETNTDASRMPTPRTGLENFETYPKGNSASGDINRARPGGSFPPDTNPAGEMYPGKGGAQSPTEKFGGFGDQRDAQLGPFKGSDGKYYADPRMTGQPLSAAAVEAAKAGNYTPYPESGTPGVSEGRFVDNNPYPESGTRGPIEGRFVDNNPYPESGTTGPVEKMGEHLRNYELEFQKGDGIIKNLKNWQGELKGMYPDGKYPPNVKVIMDTDPETLARKFESIQGNKSFVVHPGESTGFDEEGNFVLWRKDGSIQKLIQWDGSAGDKLRGSYMETGKKVPLPETKTVAPIPEIDEPTPGVKPQEIGNDVLKMTPENRPMPAEGNKYLGALSERDRLSAYEALKKRSAIEIVQKLNSPNPGEFRDRRMLGLATWIQEEYQRTSAPPNQGETVAQYVWRTRALPDKPRGVWDSIVDVFRTPGK